MAEARAALARSGGGSLPGAGSTLPAAAAGAGSPSPHDQAASSGAARVHRGCPSPQRRIGRSLVGLGLRSSRRSRSRSRSPALHRAPLWAAPAPALEQPPGSPAPSHLDSARSLHGGGAGALSRLKDAIFPSPAVSPAQA
eukprot:tig00000889_g5307.t1